MQVHIFYLFLFKITQIIYAHLVYRKTISESTASIWKLRKQTSDYGTFCVVSALTATAKILLTLRRRSLLIEKERKI